MVLIEKISPLQEEIKTFRTSGDKKIGFVPTMGALHEGHASLIKKAKEENDLVVCSIFVNPTQFNEQKDLINYPRTLDQDKAISENAGCDILFVPGVKEIYPDENPVLLNMDFDGLEISMEGLFRKGHFNGMATVVKRLLEIVSPDNAYFGEKDFQQLAIVKQLVKNLNLPINIIACPTIRETDGLAMSSRNIRLSNNERKEALLISKALFEARENAHKGLNVSFIKEKAVKSISESPLLELEYFEIVNPETLKTLDYNEPAQGNRACIAVRVGNVRLIDNIGL